jgi:hypothetical protein
MSSVFLSILAGVAATAGPVPTGSQDTILFCNVGLVDKKTFNKPGVQLKGVAPFHPFAVFFDEKPGVDNEYSTLRMVDPDKIFQGFTFKNLKIKTQGRDLYSVSDTANAGAMLVGFKQETFDSSFIFSASWRNRKDAGYDGRNL